jgi:ApbE superfamily uncharacterized protein (UPF0280 family)
MATTFTWTFDPLETATEGDLTDVVKTVHWRITGVTDDDEPVSGTVYGSISTGDADSDSFTAFADLTEADVKGWVLANLAEGEETASEAETRYQTQVQIQIDGQKTPAVESKSPPWA